MNKVTTTGENHIDGAAESLDLFINRLLGQSFEGWTEEAKNGYTTALITIKEKIANGTLAGAIATDVK